MNEERPALSIASLRRLVRNAVRTVRAIWIEARDCILDAWLIAVATAVIPLLDAWVFGRLINRLTGQNGLESVQLLVLAVIVITGSIPILYAVKYYLERRSWYVSTKVFDLLVTRKKAQLDIASYESNRVQDIFMLAQQEGSWRPANFVACIANLVWNSVSVGLAFTALIASQPWLCLPLLCGAMPALLVELWSGEAMWGIFSARGFTKRRFWHILGCFQHSGDLGEIKIYQNAPFFIDKLRELYGQFEVEELKVEKRKLLYQIAALCLYQLTYAYVLFSLVQQVFRQSIPIGSFTFLLVAVGTFRTALSGFFNDLGRMYDHERYVNNIWELLDLKPLLQWRGGKKPEAFDLQFDNITGGDPSYPEPLFRELSLTIGHGERVAIVGPNGAGKTTLKRFLQRDFDPHCGRILIGGQDLRELAEQELYRLIAFLSQESTRYHFSAKEVIGLGCSSLPLVMQELQRAAEMGGAHAFIQDPAVLPLGYDQLLGKPDGKGLSGGQWRRIAISRALYRLKLQDVPILVLDEPTAQVDGQTAAELFRALRAGAAGRTIILMSHLLADIKAIADRIVVLSHGRVVEDGNHDQLMRQRGVYFDLFQYQEKGYPAS